MPIAMAITVTVGCISPPPAVTPPPEPPQLVQREIAEIVAGEVRVVPQARLAVACTALADWREGVSLDRWYGRARPSASDREVVHRAIDGQCPYPRFRFVGNRSDWNVWRRREMVHGEPVWTWKNEGWVVVATE